MFKKVSIKTINKNKTSKTLLNVFMLTFIMFIVGMSAVYALSYTVSYNNNTGSGTMSDSTFTSNPGTLSTNTFTKTGYKFMGWNKNSGATSDWYRETNDITAEDGDDITLYAQWCKNTSATLKINNTEVKDKYGNYVFRNNKYITVKADNKTITYGGTPTYSYTVTGTLNGASGVTGTASYTVKDGSNNTVTTNPIPAGTYTVSVSGLSAAIGYVVQNTNTGTLTVNPQQCAAPTDVAILTGGRVTWTASENENCTKYKISIDDSTFTENVTSGYNFLNTIIAETGTRNVYVRAYSDSDNYSESTSATASATVYAITFDSNDTNKGTVSPTTYNVISGVTVSGGTANLLISGRTSATSSASIKTITATANTADHYEFKSWSKTSGTLTSSQTITATFDTQTFKVETSGGSNVTQSDWSYYATRTTYSRWNGGGGPYCYSCGSINPITGTWSYSGQRTRSAGCNCQSTSSTTSSSGTVTIKLIGSASSSNCGSGSGSCKQYSRPQLAVCSSATNCFINKDYGETIGTLPTATKTGYTFDGWWTAASGGTQVQSTDVITGAKTIYAHWTPNTYTVTADPQGGEISSTTGWTLVDNPNSDDNIVDIDKVNNYINDCTECSLAENGIMNTYDIAMFNQIVMGDDPTDHKFWNIQANNSANVIHLIYSESQLGYYLFTDGDQDKIFINEADSGIFESYPVVDKVSTKTVTYGSTYGTLPTVTRNAFEFVEWNTAVDGSGTTVTSTKTVSMAANHTIYAIWEEKSYNVSFLKTDQHTRIPLPGVQFTLTGTNYDGETVTKTATSGSNGEVSFTVPVGEYEIVETQTIEGYHLDEKIIYVSVVDDEEEGD